jgi:hypothetical protein
VKGDGKDCPGTPGSRGKRLFHPRVEHFAP